MTTTTETSTPAPASPRVNWSDHPCVIQADESRYTAELTDEQRAHVEQLAETAHRTGFYNATPEDVALCNEWSLEKRIKLDVWLCYQWAKDRLALQLVKEDIVYQIDPDTGEPALDENDKPIIESRSMPDHDFTITVTVEGQTDAYGVPIPKGKCYFRRTLQSSNRPANKSNYEGLTHRLPKWCYNGETQIKDADGMGVSEQHTDIAVCISHLTGKLEADWRAPVSVTDGIHPLAAITVDTGKSNSGKDIFASDPELLPIDLLQTPESLLGLTSVTEYLPDRVHGRVSALGKCEGAAKMIIPRMAGKGVQTSNCGIPKGDANQSTELAHKVVSTILPDLDDLAAYCFAFESPKFVKGGAKNRIVPVSPTDMCAALALYAMRDAEPIDVLGVGNGATPLEDAKPIRFDVESFLPLLQAVKDSDKTEGTALTDWMKTRASRWSQLGNSKADKFAQVCRMVTAFFEEDSVPGSLHNKDEWNVGGKGAFYHFGGADRGQYKKPKKGDE